MKLAVAAANLDEVQALIAFLQNQAQQLNPFHFRLKNLEIQILITGLGMLRTTYGLTRYFQHQSVDLFIHSGLAIPISEDLNEAKVYQVSDDIFFNEKRDKSPLDKLVVSAGNKEFPFDNGKLKNPHSGRFLPLAVSITNESGQIDEESIQSLKGENDTGLLLTWDNSAVFFTAILEKINFFSIRAALASKDHEDNFEGNKKEAITLLNSTLIDIILTLTE